MDQPVAKKIQRRKSKEERKGGPPGIEVDLKQLKDLMQFKPTLSMTAGFFDISKKTIERIIDFHYKMTFSEFREHNMAGTKLKLIQLAMKRAYNGSDDMLKYCLNNMCGWSYNPEPELDSDPIEDMVF
jgi:rRNA maturation protein Rpf1